MPGGSGAVAFVKMWLGGKCIQFGAAEVGKIGIEGDQGPAALTGEGQDSLCDGFGWCVDFCFML